MADTAEEFVKRYEGMKDEIETLREALAEARRLLTSQNNVIALIILATEPK